MAAKITPEMYAAIPALILQGKTATEIARLYGVTDATLKVMCSHHKISLRQPRKPRPSRPSRAQRPRAVLAVSESTLTLLRSTARKMGVEDVQLASRLLETIAKDNLFHAVLDTEAA